MKSSRLVLVCVCLLFAWSTSTWRAQARPPAGPAEQLVGLVNALREEHGLPALNAHPVLMQLAQEQANYLAQTGTGSHLSANNLRPFQRALAAGYPVAGDLSLGGFFSENVQMSPGLTPQEAVKVWTGDELHSNTMLSEWRSDLGAGFATDGSMNYYVLDAALAGSPASVSTQAAELALDLSTGQSFPVLAPGTTSTPQADGSIVHTVRQGETLWGIAAVYQVSLDQVAEYNRLNRERFLHPGDQLLVRLPGANPGTPLASRQIELPPAPRLPVRPAREPAPVPAVLAQPAAARAAGSPGWVQAVGWALLLVAVIGGIALAVDWKRQK